MSAVISKRVARFAASATALGAATEVTIQVANRKTKLIIQRVHLVRSAGTAANYTPRIVSITGAAINTIGVEWQGVATAVAVPVDSKDLNVHAETDDLGRLYLVGGWDAGADNAVDYVLFFEITE